MAVNVLTTVLIATVASNDFLAAASPVLPEEAQLLAAPRQMALEMPAADQQGRILKILSAFDVAQKSANPVGDPIISGVKAYAKRYGKKVEMEGINEDPSDHPTEQSKSLLEINPLPEKSFWKPALPTSWKIKRACFWKYCVERK